MIETPDIFDLLPEDDETRVKYAPIKSVDWKWSMAEDYPRQKNGLKVFSCFACGGGSTMGYKLAGCDVIGCCEIDPRMNRVYVENHHPKYNFLMDIRKFNETPNEELPEELFNLDILDGSPPCTTFSMVGDRKDSWGKKKKFREGQAEQTLDDLSFIFIDTVAKLKPKCVVMENVEGFIKGDAWSYVQRIYKHFKDIGYTVKHWLLKCEQMGVPQARHRVIFIAIRNGIDFDLEGLDMSFNYEPVLFGSVKEGTGVDITEKPLKLLRNVKDGEMYLSNAHKRLFGKRSWFTHAVCRDDYVLLTISAGHAQMYRYPEMKKLSDEDYRNAQTFPRDYNFLGQSVAYICGMSVPPIMMKRVVTRLIESGLFEQKE
jgi:DNA (cytosine-5)-methyltransferase 1